MIDIQPAYIDMIVIHYPARDGSSAS